MVQKYCQSQFCSSYCIALAKILVIFWSMRNELRLEFKLFFFVWHNTLRRFYHLYIYDIYDKSDKEQDFFFFLN